MSQLIRYRLSIDNGAEDGGRKVSKGELIWEIETPYVVDFLLSHVCPWTDRRDLDIIESKVTDSGGKLRWEGIDAGAGETVLEWTREVGRQFHPPR